MKDTGIIVGMAAVAVVIGVVVFLNGGGSAPSTQLATSGANNTTSSVVTAPVQARTVTFRVLDTGTHAAGISERKNYAAYSEEGFIKLWNVAHGTDGTALPEIDFSKEYVIGVFAGQKPTGGHSVIVASVTDKGDIRTVAVTLTSPGEDCMVTQSLTNPYQIVAVPLSDASLAHTDSEVSTPCN